MNDTNGLRTVDRTLDILECFDQHHIELGISDIAKRIELPKSTTHRIIKTLELRGYIVQNPGSQKYRLGGKFLRLGKMFLSGVDYRQVALPYMHEILEQLNESVNLYVADGEKRICIERLESTEPLRRVIKIGDSLPISQGAAGKVLLAYGASTSKVADETVLAEIRTKGYAVSHGERAIGASSVAAPIFGSDDKIIAALAITGPTSRFQEPRLTQYISVVVDQAKAISLALGR